MSVHIHLQKWIVYTSFLLVMIGFSGCRGAQETEIPFQTIAKDVGGLDYTSEEPALLIVTRREEFEALDLEIHDPDLLEQVEQIDYEKYFVILVFQGFKYSGGYQVTVQKISLTGEQMIIQTDFAAPWGTRATQMVTSPYHLIAVPKARVQGRQVQFLLVVNDEALIEVSREMP